MKHIVQFIFLLVLMNLAHAQRTDSINLNKGWQFRKAGTDHWFKAEVPGTIHTDLLANKLIPDPFYRDNESKVQWVENETWEYKTTFDIPDHILRQKHIELQFDGLDTYAEVYLNGQKIISADNMFRQWTKGIAPFARAKNNQLLVVFPPASALAKLLKKADSITRPDNERVYVRKAQYQFGWDWGPRMVTCGIWKDVRIIGKGIISIDQLDIVPVNDSLVLRTTIESYTSGDFYLKTVFRKDTTYFKISLSSGVTFFEIPVAAKDASFENNKPFKADNLIISIESEEARSYFQAVFPYAGKNVQLVTKKDSIGESFYFTINGQPTFIKGANWIPSESFLPRAKKIKRYEQLIKAAKEANVNMLRVWGGGVYEDDVFYDLCDKYGIMVWQDFMFAGAMYPAGEDFLRNVEEEIRYQVKKLRHHPSIVLWCGNNEIEEAWFNWGWQRQFNYSATDSLTLWNDYKKLFHELIPGILKELDPERPYWPSSPSLGWGRDSAYKKGDVHYWGVWWGKEPVEKYNEKAGRFVSEYGMQGMPDMKTIKQFSLPRDWDTSSVVMRTHQKHPFGWENIKYYIEQRFRTPKSFEDLVYVSQLMQADAIKKAIEAHRRNKPTTMGTLFWQWNDCWPVTSWSAIDYYGRKKALYYEVKRSFSNTVILPYYQNDLKGEKVCLKAESASDDSLIVKVDLFDLVKMKRYSLYSDFTFKASERPFWCFYNDLPSPYDSSVYRFRVFRGKTEVATNYLFPLPPKDLELPPVKIQYRILPGAIELIADSFAYGVWIDLPDGVEPEDNYFHLFPGEKKIVKFTSSIPTDQLKKQIRIKSLADTY